MTLAPLFNADLVVQIHFLSALVALAMGAVIFQLRKGNWWHRMLGRAWVVFMAVAILSSFFITGFEVIGPFSPIHIFSVLGSIGLIQGVVFAVTGQIGAHRRIMRELYFGALIVAGTLAFLPGRVLSEMVFGAHAQLGFALVAGGVGAAFLLRAHIRRKANFSRR